MSPALKTGNKKSRYVPSTAHSRNSPAKHPCLESVQVHRLGYLGIYVGSSLHTRNPRAEASCPLPIPERTAAGAQASPFRNICSEVLPGRNWGCSLLMSNKSNDETPQRSIPLLVRIATDSHRILMCSVIKQREKSTYQQPSFFTTPVHTTAPATIIVPCLINPANEADLDPLLCCVHLRLGLVWIEESIPSISTYTQ